MPETTTGVRASPSRAEHGPARTAGLPLPAVLTGLAIALAATAIASIVVGAENIGARQALTALFGGDVDRQTHLLVFEYRLPRTLVAIAVGTALGVAGAVIQAYTRNPLADPGILGVNAGAAFAVTVAFGTGLSASPSSLVWPALIGAGAATVAVLLLASAGRGPATPVRMTLAGVALAAIIGGITTGIRLSDPTTFERLRSWQAGSVAGRSLADLAEVAPHIGVGLFLAVLLLKPLNAIVAEQDEPEATVSNEMIGTAVGDADMLFIDSDLRGEVNAFMAALQETPLYRELPAVQSGNVYAAGKNTIAGYTDANYTLDMVELALEDMR